MLLLKLGPFQTCQGTQTHVHDGRCLNLGKVKAFHQAAPGLLHGLTAADDGNDFINEIKGLQESLYEMIPLFSLIQIIFAAPGDNILLML